MRTFPILVLGLATLLIQLFASPVDGAQASKPAGKTITGTVTDALGRPLEGVGLELQNSAGKIVAKAESDAKGHFISPTSRPRSTPSWPQKRTSRPRPRSSASLGGGQSRMMLALQSEAALSMAVVAQRLNKSRNSLSPETGGSVYRFSEKAIQELPQGNNTALNQVLLQAPGVVQDSYGQLHVRGDHANLQYRINGVQLAGRHHRIWPGDKPALCPEHQPADWRAACTVRPAHRRHHRHQDQGGLAG